MLTDTLILWARGSMDEWLERQRLEARCGVCDAPVTVDQQDGCEECDQ